MGRIVSVTRILNEDDIAEAFVRHNARHADHMLFLDNGSTDATLPILYALKQEGLPLAVFSTPSVNFEEVAANSWAYQAASQLFGADWVVFIDADEFINTPSAAPLAGFLTGTAHTAELVNYGQTERDDPDEVIVPCRQRHRWAGDTKVEKLLVRAGLPGLTIGAGNHCAYADGQKRPATRLADVTFAHYPRRSGWQILQKMAAGWLKAEAGGQAVLGAGHSAHYRSPFATLRDKPHELLLNPRYFAYEFPMEQAIEAPLDYLGGALRYTQPTDPAMKAAHVFLCFAERLALQHGRLLDESREAKALVERWNAERRFLF
jgi:glycosyltransferase involved in cell wall biosynthesis